MPTAVLRRYTPPTCTLEVAASGSALSRWTDRTVLKHLRFQLNFDDPKLMPDQQVTISGDQSQLEALYEAVSDYVQRLVGSSASAINWEPSLLGDAPPQAHPAEIAPAEINLAHQDIDLGTDLDNNLDNHLGIALTPQGLLSHELRLGSLANDESGPALRLSLLQLFDLANALEAYHTESLSLPVAERSTWISRLPRRWPTAAAAVLALGATGVMTKFVLDISRPAAIQTASAPTERQVNAELNRELFPKLSPPPVSPSAKLQPLPPPPPTGATPSADALGLPPIGVTQAPPPAASKSGPALGQLPSPLPGQLPAPSSQSQVTMIPSSGVASLPSADLAAPGQADAVATNPPRLVPDANTSEARMAPTASRAAAGAAAPSVASSAASGTTAFDTIPQVAEVRSYFQQRWQPPSGLSQPLEYRLLLNADGSLQRIVPLGQFSENYLDRTDMPLLGESFVSAAQNGETPQIRLVLKPDGKVQSFLEYAN